jgi:hypothetical protein
VAEIVLYGDAWPQRIPIGGSAPTLLQGVINESAGFPASLNFSGARVGMRVVGAIGFVLSFGLPVITDATSAFESVISIDNKIQQIAAAVGNFAFITLATP